MNGTRKMIAGGLLAGSTLRGTAYGAGYETHVTKSDGSRATVKLDENFKVTSVETDNGPRSSGGRGNGSPRQPADYTA